MTYSDSDFKINSLERLTLIQQIHSLNIQVKSVKLHGNRSYNAKAETYL